MVEEWMCRDRYVKGRWTYSNLGRNKIDLVKHKNQMLMRCLGTDVLLDRAATSSIGITGV
jgi:hypothetical protein